MEKILYANGFRVAIGPGEAQICLNVETPIIDEKTNQVVKVEIDNVADVRMTPYVAKLLLNALSNSVADYEAQFGELKILSKQEERTNE